MIVILTGAQKNIGDYLIGARAKDLLREYVDENIVEFPRFKKLDEYIDVINSSRALFLCGGPAYAENIYPGIYPLVENLDEIKVPIVPFGLGWSGKPPFNPDNFQFSHKSEKFLHRIHKNIEYSSCRDELTLGILHRYKISNVIMTGCPVWYDLPSIGKEFESGKEIKHIVFTPPANAKLVLQSIKIISLIKRIYPHAALTVSFHRGIWPDAKTRIRQSAGYLTIAAFARGVGANVVDVSYDLERIKFYGDCDLHIGYRVHAHLYFLSKRIPSVLVNEDGRGLGQVKTMKLPILNFSDHDLVYNLDQVLNSYNLSGFVDFKNVASIIDTNFKEMKQFLKSMQIIK